MKRINHSLVVSLLMISGLIAGCQRQQNGHFRVTVILQHAPIQKVFLDEMKLKTANIVDTDQIQDASGRFSFAGITPEEELYRIRFGQGKTLLLVIAGGDNIQVTGDYDHLDQVRIEGSPASAELGGFLRGLERQTNSLARLSEEYQALKAGKAADSLVIAKGVEIQQKTAGISGSILHFAQGSQSPAATVFALSLLQAPAELKAAKPVFDGLVKRFPNSMLVQSFLDQYHQYMNDSGATAAVSVGSPAPEISYPDPQGKVISLSSFKGKYVLVDFWASWCGPCREENPNVVKAYNKFRNKNFAILGVSLDTKKDSWIKAIKDDSLSWSQVSDLKGWDSAPAAAYGVEAIPANFLVDPQGKVIATDLRGEDLENTLAKVLK